MKNRPCPSGKRQYSSRLAATRALVQVGKRRGASGEARIYRCPKCSRWHLTSSV